MPARRGMSMEAIFPTAARDAETRDRLQLQLAQRTSATTMLRRCCRRGRSFTCSRVRQHQGNKSNPDPDQWVGWGDRTVDEMGPRLAEHHLLQRTSSRRSSARGEDGQLVHGRSPATVTFSESSTQAHLNSSGAFFGIGVIGCAFVNLRWVCCCHARAERWSARGGGSG